MQSREVKVVEVLSASDLNIKYLDCVESYISAWLRVPVWNEVKFVPKVLIVANAIPESLLPFSDFLALVDPLDLPTAFVAQTARIIEARNSNADFVMTSDIDMLPLNLSFESGLVKSQDSDSDKFYILRDVLLPGQYPICYNLANPRIWGLLLKSYGDHTSTVKILKDIIHHFGGESSYSGVHGGDGWTFDQQALWILIQNHTSGIRVEKFLDFQTKHRRLDRSRHRSLLKWFALPLVFLGFYHDYHVHHPVSSNKKYVKAVLKIRDLGLRLRLV